MMYKYICVYIHIIIMYIYMHKQCAESWACSWIWVIIPYGIYVVVSILLIMSDVASFVTGCHTLDEWGCVP